jgi:uncharacterized protein (DUF58 family)
MLTRRGWVALVGGVAAYVVAFGFGAAALVPLALALTIGPLAAAGLLRRHRHAAVRLTIAFDPSRPRAAADFTATARLDGSAPGGGQLLMQFGAAQLGAPLVRESDGVYLARFTVPGLPRGVHAVRDGELSMGDPFGFARADRSLSGTSAVIVWPRWTEPGSVADGVAGDGDLGLRARRAQPVGYDLHGIREHQHGESLRRVDWKTSARTGRLMVREMEDASRADLSILVDLDRAEFAADPDTLERLLEATATLVRGVGAEGQQATLVLVGATVQRIPLDGGSGSWFAAMDALAAAQADRELPLADAMLRDRSLLAGAALTVLTPSVAPALVALLGREAMQVPVRVVPVGGGGEDAWVAATGVAVMALPAAGAAPVTTEAVA